MIRHIVLFKLVEFPSVEEKTAKLNEIKSGLEALKDKIEQLKFIEVGINVNPNETFDLALVTEFESLADLDIYAKHPDHVAVAKIIGAVKADRSCVDFEF